MQFLYRDNDDELQVSKDIRNADQLRINNSTLIESIVEGRTRVIALCRICHGDNSLESIKSIIELANIYAVQGLWEQVSEHMAVASQKLLLFTRSYNTSNHLQMYRNSIIAAENLQCVFVTMRKHAMSYRGNINMNIMEEIKTNLIQLQESRQLNTSHNSDSNNNMTNEMEMLLYDLELFETEMNNLFTTINKTSAKRVQHIVNSSSSAQTSNTDIQLSWGEFVSFIQGQSSVMKNWINKMTDFILPQNRSILEIAFDVGDVNKRGISHPVELSINILKFPAAVRLLSGTTVIHDLSKYQHDISIYIDSSTCDIINDNNDINSIQSKQLVKYELPVTWYEVLSLVHMNVSEYDPLELLRIQILNLLGLCNVFSNKIPLAEENMKNALGILETLGLDMDLVAVDLYNSISQLMVVKHRQWHAHKNERCEKEAVLWLKTREGKDALREAIRLMKIEYEEKKLFRISSESAETKARVKLLKSHSRHLMKTEVDPTLPSLEAAYRYLVRSYEILEKAHSGRHPIVATASLAVASVQNVIGNHNESKEWLVRAIRIMEKVTPLPLRAIAFTQTQLSSILIKLKHPKSAVKVLTAAVGFYYNSVMQRLLARSRLYTSSFNSFASQVKGQQILEDIETTLHLTRRLVMLNDDIGAKWQSAEHAESMAELAEAAYGWDSKEAAEFRKLVCYHKNKNIIY
jgi:hypothetical protein